MTITDVGLSPTAQLATLGSPVWAAGQARGLLSGLPQQWAHTREAVSSAEWVSAGLTPAERDLLIAAAYLHQIGRSSALAGTGFPPLDGARYLAKLELFDLACLVAHHRCAAADAAPATKLSDFGAPGGPVVEALRHSCHP